MNLFTDLPTMLLSSSAFTVVPTSVCFTPDKNRTWALLKHLLATQGHDKGRDVAENMLQACYDAGVLHAIIWMMSESNRRKRPQEETDHLKGMLKQAILKSKEKNEPVNMYICGDLKALTDSELEDLVDERHSLNKPEHRKTLTILCAYRGLTDWKQAASRLAQDLGPEAIENEDLIRRYMWINHLPPNIDMLVRTGVNPRNKHNSDSLLPLHGENAFVWDVPQYWPDFTVADLYEGFRAYSECHRPKGA